MDCDSDGNDEKTEGKREEGINRDYWRGDMRGFGLFMLDKMPYIVFLK